MNIFLKGLYLLLCAYIGWNIGTSNTDAFIKILLIIIFMVINNFIYNSIEKLFDNNKIK